MERNRGGVPMIYRRPQKRKYTSIKFNFKYSKIEIEFLRPMNYKDTNGKLCLTIYRKPTDWQIYLHFKSTRPPSLKKIIPCSQALRISGICTKTNEVMKHHAELKEAFLKCGHQETSTVQPSQPSKTLDKTEREVNPNSFRFDI